MLSGYQPMADTLEVGDMFGEVCTCRSESTILSIAGCAIVAQDQSRAQRAQDCCASAVMGYDRLSQGLRSASLHAVCFERVLLAMSEVAF